VPALPPIPNTLKLELGFEYTIPARLFGSRLFFSFGAGQIPTVADLHSFCVTAANDWNTYLAPHMSSDRQLASIIAQDMSSQTGAVAEATGIGAGLSAGAAIVGNACTVINFAIARHYRGGKPKIFLPLGTESDLLDQTAWGSPYLTALTTAWQSWVSALTAVTTPSFNTSAQVAVSYYAGYQKTTPPWRGPGFPYPLAVRPTPLTYPVTAFAVRARIGSQRRRIAAAA
jgi:hypothetical protein